MKKYYEIPTYEEDTRWIKAVLDHQVICPCCKHRILMISRDRELCYICKHWVYKNKKSEFKYKIKEEISRRKLNEN